MKRLSMWAFVGLAVAFGTTSCDRSSERKPAAEPPLISRPRVERITPTNPLPRPLFWSIEKDGKTSYALGTIHIGVDAKQRLPAIVWDKLDSAPVFAMEADTNDPALANAVACANCSLRRDLSPEQYARLEEALSPFEVKAVDAMKPMAATVLLSMRAIEKTSPMDGELRQRAAAAGKQVVFLEGANVQIAALDKWMNLRALKMLLADLPGADALVKQTFEAYVAGDDAGMLAVSERERVAALKLGYTPEEYTAQMEDLLYARNAAWIASIEKLHASGGGFIAVGAMHLIGDRSVLDLLGRKGYRIQRVTR